MKKLFSLVIVLLVMLSTPALADGELIVTQKAFALRPSSLNPSKYNGIVCAEIANTGDKPAWLMNSTIEVYDQNGNFIKSSDVISCYPPVLNPGDIGFIYREIPGLETEDENYIYDYKLILTSANKDKNVIKRLPGIASYEKLEQSTSEIEFYAKLGMISPKYQFSATITNNTKSIIRKITAVIALYDSNDNLIYSTTISPSNLGIPAGQTVVLYAKDYYNMMELWEENGISPERIMVIAYSED